MLTYPTPTSYHSTYFHYLVTLKFDNEQTNRRLEQLLWKRCGLDMDEIDILFLSSGDIMLSIFDALLFKHVSQHRLDSFIFAFTASQEYLINAERIVKDTLINLKIPIDLYKIVACYHIDWNIRTVKSC